MIIANGPLETIANLAGAQGMLSAALTPGSIALLAACIVAEVAYQLGFKTVAERADSAHHLRSIISQPLLWLCITLWAIEVVAWLLVLQHVPLEVAYPVMTLTYAAVPIAGVFALKEKMLPAHAAGAALVFAGVICVSLSHQ